MWNVTKALFSANVYSYIYLSDLSFSDNFTLYLLVWSSIWLLLVTAKCPAPNGEPLPRFPVAQGNVVVSRIKSDYAMLTWCQALTNIE
jgi:hypothetical protein